MEEHDVLLYNKLVTTFNDMLTFGIIKDNNISFESVQTNILNCKTLFKQTPKISCLNVFSNDNTILRIGFGERDKYGVTETSVDIAQRIFLPLNGVIIRNICNNEIEFDEINEAFVEKFSNRIINKYENKEQFYFNVLVRPLYFHKLKEIELMVSTRVFKWYHQCLFQPDVLIDVYEFRSNFLRLSKIKILVLKNIHWALKKYAFLVAFNYKNGQFFEVVKYIAKWL